MTTGEKPRAEAGGAEPSAEAFMQLAFDHIATLRSELARAAERIKVLEGALQRANEHVALKHAPHTRTGEGGVTEHNPANCTKCIIDAALSGSQLNTPER